MALRRAGQHFVGSVSYTHLDVYKRQPWDCSLGGAAELQRLRQGRAVPCFVSVANSMVRRESCTSSKGENVMRLVAHATEDLEAAAQTFRFVPNCLGGLAEVPIAPRARVVDAMSVPEMCIRDRSRRTSANECQT